jgi:23S rRNA (adenine2503-C2)-methyltransferase
MSSFFDLTFDQLAAQVQAWGQPAYRAKQIWQAVYRDLAASPDAITTLGKPLRQQLAESLPLSSLTPAVSLTSSDEQTRKTLFNLADGRAIETVLMSYDHDGTKSRQTVCLSSQAGCALGCVFCATGQMGFQRNLTAGEMVEQVVYYARMLKSEGEVLTNVVVMGMGEPFLNYNATLAAIDRLNDAEGFNFGERRFTVSTVGLPAMIERFAADHRQINLAVSLHAASDKLRSRLLPINRQHSLSALLPAIRHYTELTHRRVTFEWALIRGVNDDADQAALLADLVAGLLCHVNLIQLNPSQGYGEAGSTREQAEAFKAVLDERKIPCTIRVRRGIDIHAGCGQLAGRVS